MERRHILIAKSYSDNKFFMKISHNNQDMVSRSQMIFHRNLGDVITHVIEKKSGHRYFLDIKDADHPKLNTNIKLCCKRSAIFVKRQLEEYDDTLKIDIIKFY